MTPHGAPRRPHGSGDLGRARRVLGALVAAVLAAGCTGDGGGSATSTTAPAVTPARPFAPTSFWNARLAADAPVDPRSSRWAASLVRQIADHYGNATLNTTDYAAPVYTVDAAVAPQRVGVWDCQGKGADDAGLADLARQLAAVPLPRGAAPAGGTDSELVVWQPSTDTMWELWRARHRADGGLEACWGGRLDHVSTGDGTFPNPFGTTATGLPLLGGLIRIDELRAGRIGHVVDLSLPKAAPSWVAPATRGDGSGPEDGIPEGTLLRLPVDVDLDALRLHPVARLIAEAVRDHGMIVRDTAGAVSLYAENPAPRIAAGEKDPYDGLLGGTPTYQVLDRFPWERLVAVPPAR